MARSLSQEPVGEAGQLPWNNERFDLDSLVREIVEEMGQAAQQMTEPFPDLVFLDIRVSGSNGQIICQHLKSQPATRHIPIILLSAHRDTRRIARECSADNFLTKPFQMEAVLAFAVAYLGSA